MFHSFPLGAYAAMLEPDDYEMTLAFFNSWTSGNNI
jgi:hypothetical protein